MLQSLIRPWFRALPLTPAQMTAKGILHKYSLGLEEVPPHNLLKEKAAEDAQQAKKGSSSSTLSFLKLRHLDQYLDLFPAS